MLVTAVEAFPPLATAKVLLQPPVIAVQKVAGTQG